MSDDNKIVSIKTGGRGESGYQDQSVEPSRNELTAQWLRELAAMVERGEMSDKTAIAFFVERGNEIEVMCGGFADDQRAIGFLRAFIRNMGFAN